MPEAGQDFIARPTIGIPVKGEPIRQVGDVSIAESEHFPFRDFPPTISVVRIPDGAEAQQDLAANLVDLVQTSAHHARSYEIPLPKSQIGTIWLDRNGILFGAVNIKGNNLEDPRIERDDNSPSGFRVNGLLEETALERIVMVSELLSALGIDSEKIEAIIRPEELIVDGRRVTIEEFRTFLMDKTRSDSSAPKPFSLGWLTGQAADKTVTTEDLPDVDRFLKNLSLVFIIRSQQVPERPRDLEQAKTPEEFNRMMSRVFAFINTRDAFEAQSEGREPRVLSADNPTDVEFYFTDYLPKRLAVNIAKFHNAGLTHGFLTGHNVSLAGSIYDLDSVYGPILGDKLEPDQKEDIIKLIDELGSTFSIQRSDRVGSKFGRQIPYFKEALAGKYMHRFFVSFVETYLGNREFDVDLDAYSQTERSEYLSEMREYIDKGRMEGLGSRTFLLELEMTEQEEGMTIDEVLRKDSIERALKEAFRTAVPLDFDLNASGFPNDQIIRDSVDQGFKNALARKVDELEGQVDPKPFRDLRTEILELARAA